MTDFGKEEWTDMFRETGLSEDQMHRWHGVFEKRFPEAHLQFLKWLQVPQSDIDRIRDLSRNDWS